LVRERQVLISEYKAENDVSEDLPRVEKGQQKSLADYSE
jgi:hypothetical protein